MSWWTAERSSYAVNFLVGNGLSPWGAAALVARWKYVEASAGPTSRGGYMNRAWGIAQWLGSRLPPINGNPNFDDQLAYVIQELQGPESRAFQVLQTAGDAMTGAIGASLYERAGGFNSSTGRDNYTNKTASYAPGILAEWQARGGSNNTVIDNGVYSAQLLGGNDGLSTMETAGLGVGAILGIGLGLVALYLVVRD